MRVLVNIFLLCPAIRFLNNIEESIQDTFNEFDYLTLEAPASSNETYSANGVMNEVIVEETVDNINAQVLKRKAIRGGSWKDVAYFIQTSTRNSEYQDTAKSYIGFRCAVDFLGRDKKDFE